LGRTVHPKHSIEEMRDLAIVRGGKCLSIEYVDSKSKLLWQCARGHQWQALPSSVVQGSWCPACAHNQRLGLSEFHDLAASRGGECLSCTYVNERTHLRWRCAEGHRWNATPEKVKRGSWCPTCAILLRRSRWVPRGTANLNDRERTTTRMRTRHTRIREVLLRARVKIAK
jgi:hypothetical protein